MIQIRHILCCVDFSDFSRRALDHAVAIAKWYDARLTVMYAYSIPMAALASAPLLSPAPMEVAVLSPTDRESLRRQLVECLPRSAAGIPIDCRVVEGDVATEILAAAGTADLLVVGTHGRSGFERLVLGSVAERLLRQARCPLLIVPRASPDATDTVPQLFHHIVAAIDFSPSSDHAAAFAISLAEEADADLTLVHALDLSPAVETWIVESEAGTSRLRHWQHDVSVRLHDLVPSDAGTYCHIEEQVEAGSASRVILDVAAARRAGLIVIGAHGGGSLDRLFVGSTAQRVVREAACPVLIVRASESTAGTTP
jgi:nucleotide-binding universal stress UspA family protein